MKYPLFLFVVFLSACGSNEPEREEMGPMGDLVDPNCTDGMYVEEVADPTLSVDSLVSNYSPSNYLTFHNEILDVRYPIAAYITREAQEKFTAFDCVETFLHDTDTAEGVVKGMGTTVHECGHMLDNASGMNGEGFAWVVTPDLYFQCTDGDTTSRGGKTFARSRINGDNYSALLPDDFYKSTYLNGDPDDDVFEGGDQGFNSVIEEALQYVNTAAISYAMHDFHTSGNRTGRAGMLAFQWYIQRYLRMARLEYPDAYAHIMGDSCWRELILTVWGRGWLYYELGEGIPGINLYDDRYYPLVTDPEMVSEIQRVRDAHGCE